MKHSYSNETAFHINIAQSDLAKEQALYVRNIVFVEEQQVSPEDEMDEHDNEAIHFIGYNEKNEPIAASRLRWVDSFGKLERICVLKQYRGKSFGKQLIAAMETVIKDYGVKKALLHSQTHAQNFYEQLGYEICSEEFLDAGIPHVKMVKTLT